MFVYYLGELEVSQAERVTCKAEIVNPKTKTHKTNWFHLKSTFSLQHPLSACINVVIYHDLTSDNDP